MVLVDAIQHVVRRRAARPLHALAYCMSLCHWASVMHVERELCDAKTALYSLLANEQYLCIETITITYMMCQEVYTWVSNCFWTSRSAWVTASPSIPLHHTCMLSQCCYCYIKLWGESLFTHLKELQHNCPIWHLRIEWTTWRLGLACIKGYVDCEPFTGYSAGLECTPREKKKAVWQYA